MAEKTFRRTWSGRLAVIEQFGIDIAMKVRPGMRTKPNHSGGDLYNSRRHTFIEVKASGLSGGALIREVQLQQHFDSLEKFDHEYVIVFYQNRRWSKGKYHTLPMRVGKTKRLLRKFLVENIREVYVLHVSVIWAIYNTHPELVKIYQMKEGPRRVFKLTQKKVKGLISDIQDFSRIGLDPTLYEFTKLQKKVRIDGSSVSIYVYQITPRIQTEDDSFNVTDFEGETA